MYYYKIESPCWTWANKYTIHDQNRVHSKHKIQRVDATTYTSDTELTEKEMEILCLRIDSERYLKEALIKVSELPQDMLDAISIVIAQATIEGDYNGRDSDGGSFWVADARQTLDNLADKIKNIKQIIDKESIHGETL